MTVRFLETEHSFQGTIIIGCNGLSALNKARLDSDFANPNEPQFDLITSIQQIRQQSVADWQWRHIKGHQDNTRPLHELDQWSKWNIAMDAAAKAHWSNTFGKQISEPLVGEPWPMIVEGKKIVSNLRQELRIACTTPPALDYWHRKACFGSTSPSDIDWDSLGYAMTSLPIQRQHWICKTVSGFCSTGRMMLQRKERATDKCPRCGQPEDVVHVWRCRHDTEKLWKKALSDLQSWLENNGSHPEITNLIINKLSRWRLGNDLADSSSHHIPWLRELSQKQDSCGWRNFFEGFLLNDWYTIINHHFTRTRSRKSPRRWISALIRKLWLIAWDLWEHRNGFLHDKDQSILISQLDAQIAEQFEIGHTSLDVNTKSLFKQGLPFILKRPIDVKHQWLRRVCAARDNAALGDNARFGTKRQIMARWLGLRGQQH